MIGGRDAVCCVEGDTAVFARYAASLATDYVQDRTDDRSDTEYVLLSPFDDMNLKKMLYLCLSAGLISGMESAYAHVPDEMPIETVQRIGDKLIRETPFEYQLVVAPRQTRLAETEFVDFGRTFGTRRPAEAYAYTQLTSDRDTVLLMEIEHNDACSIWCNDRLVYEKKGERPFSLLFEERSVEMSFSFSLPLRKGVNTLLVKSATGGGEWCVMFQLPSDKDAVLAYERWYPEIGLSRTPRVSREVASLSNWLVCGPFAVSDDCLFDPVQPLRFGTMYAGLDGGVTWTIPKQEVLGDVIDPAPWGTPYQWNYHNGGVAWAMQQLSEVSGKPCYRDWADRFCDYHIDGIPFVRHQVLDLKALKSANHFIINPSLLDFTLAPALPFIYRLRTEPEFGNREAYERFIDGMMSYARTGQIRSEGMRNYNRTTPERYTVWVDDMFMGIPFLMQAAQYAPTEEERDAFYDDAAQQVIDFTRHVWDKKAKLYMHANYTSRPEVKLPHWSRANGWAVWAMSDVLMALPETHPLYKKVLKQFRTTVRSLVRYQDASGFWRNVIDRPDSPCEVSGTAIFTMAIARGVRLGWLDAEYAAVAERAWKALTTEIDPDGTVHKICVGTMCSTDEEYYVTRPFYDDDTHGSFAVLFAGVEMQRLLNRKK